MGGATLMSSVSVQKSENDARLRADYQSEDAQIAGRLNTDYDTVSDCILMSDVVDRNQKDEGPDVWSMRDHWNHKSRVGRAVVGLSQGGLLDQIYSCPNSRTAGDFMPLESVSTYLDATNITITSILE